MMFSQNMTYLKPESLILGDTIAIVAPAGIIKNHEAIKIAQSKFEEWGFKVLIGENVFNDYHHFSATDDDRRKDMQWALDHPHIKAIWCARGGYGSTRIIDDLDFTEFAENPKWLIGYSDFTVFHNQLHNFGFATIHGPMAINFQDSWELIAESMEALKSVLTGERLEFEIAPNTYNKTGKASGVLIGGNLTLLSNQLGSPLSINTKDKILFIEEIGEHKYHIDRMLRSLDRAGYFKNFAGLVVGNFSLIKTNNPDFGQTIEEIILDIVKPYDIPVLFDFPAGHEHLNKSLIFGDRITLEITETTAKIY